MVMKDTTDGARCTLLVMFDTVSAAIVSVCYMVVYGRTSTVFDVDVCVF